jgi:hypothetical protein
MICVKNKLLATAQRHNASEIKRFYRSDFMSLRGTSYFITSSLMII